MFNLNITELFNLGRMWWGVRFYDGANGRYNSDEAFWLVLTCCSSKRKEVK